MSSRLGATRRDFKRCHAVDLALRPPKRRVRRVTLAREATMTRKPSAALAVRVGSVEIEGLYLSGVVALVRALGS